MAGRHSPERGGISNQNKSAASPPVCSAGTRKDWRLLRPSALTESRRTARLPTARLPFCGGGKKKKKPVAVQRTAGFPNKTGTQCVYTRFPNVYAPRGGLHVPLSPTLESPELHSASLCALLCATISTVQRQHGQTAATALKLERTLDYTPFFILRNSQLR